MEGIGGNGDLVFFKRSRVEDNSHRYKCVRSVPCSTLRSIAPSRSGWLDDGTSLAAAGGTMLYYMAEIVKYGNED